ncbi:glycosyltransferase family 2 protein [Cyanobium sp. CH-040]|nr:glycosyltransferase family 2 protein [Cyanobium sp. CH-040]
MSPREGLVTTIIPFFNRPGLLKEAVNSVLAQVYRPIEIILVDDGSTDDSSAIAEIFTQAHPGLVALIRQPNRGPGSARQAGLDRASGEFVQFLDSDDILLPRKFALQVAALRASPSAEIAYGHAFEENHRIDPPSCYGPIRATGVPQSLLFPRLLIERWWPTSTPLFRRDLLSKIGPIKPWITEEDWEYEARAAALSPKLVFVEENLSVTRIFAHTTRLSDAGSNDRRKLRHRALARQSIFASALKGGVSEAAPEVAFFSRAAFLLSRQCAEAGLNSEAADLHALACRAARHQGLPWSLRAYGWLARAVGWHTAARWSVAARGRWLSWTRA